MSKPIKKPQRRVLKAPREGSLAWYRREWEAVSKHKVPASMIEELAQLSYENRQMRKRLDAVEVLQLAHMFGRVEIRGVLHLMECDKRNNPDDACTCGSLPERSSTTGN